MSNGEKTKFRGLTIKKVPKGYRIPHLGGRVVPTLKGAQNLISRKRNGTL